MKYILTANAGSSSIKCAVFEQASLTQVWSAIVKGIGVPQAMLAVTGRDGGVEHQTMPQLDHAAATEKLLGALVGAVGDAELVAVGHRVVHGGPRYHSPCEITDEVLAGLQEAAVFDPEHVPVIVALMKRLREQFPAVKHIACFDTDFHHDMPRVAQLLPIPRRYQAAGLRRYGFHGLSYAYLLQELAKVAGPEAAKGRVLLAHLGNGVSLVAVRDGRPLDTTMGLTPNSGVPMSTRSGDLDPGLVTYLARTEGLDAAGFSEMAAFESGLLGVAETTGDMEQLRKLEAEDSRAKDAVDLFCYQVKKQIGAYAAVLGGLDTLVFSGGMGEQSDAIRERICEGLDFLGLTLDPARNRQQAAVISPEAAAVTVRVMRTDEAVTIAREVATMIGTET